MHFHHERSGRGWRGFGAAFGRGCGPRGGWPDFAAFGLDMAAAAAGGRRGGRRRMFDGGELRLVLLKLIGDQPRHGYDLIRAIEERTGGAYAPSPGIVYPTLTLLDDMGLIGEQQAEGARKLFAITPEGQAHLDAHAEEIAGLFARLDAVGAMRERTDTVPVRRAIHNLRSVLHHRLSEGLDKDEIHEAVALIDEVAGKIERL